MIKLILFLYLIVATSYQFISVNTDNPLLRGAALKDEVCVPVAPKVQLRRGIRSGAAIAVDLTKLSEEENEQRIAECGRVHWPLAGSLDSTPDTRVPWAYGLEHTTEQGYFINCGVLISKRHVLFDKNSIKLWDLEPIFGDFASQPSHTLSSLLRQDSSSPLNFPFKVLSERCGYFDKNCKTSSVHFPTKIVIPDSRDDGLMILEFDHDLPGNPICVPEEAEVYASEQVYIHSFFHHKDMIHSKKLTSVLANGMAVLSTDSWVGWTRILVKRRHEKFFLVGNTITKSADSKLTTFSSVFRNRDTICEWTGVCPSLPRVELKRISKGENEERLRTCGRLKDGEEGSSPWLVVIQRSDGFEFTGVAISRRHILGDWSLFDGIDLEKISGNFKERKIISTSLPITRKSAEVLNFKVSLDGLTLQPTKILMIISGHPGRIQNSMLSFSGDYVIIEMGDNLQVTPVCLPGRRETTYGDRVTLEAKGHRKESHELSWHSNGILLVNAGSFWGFLVQKRQNVSTLVGYRRTKEKHEKNDVYNRLSRDQERICNTTGVCPRHMIPLPIHGQMDRWEIEDRDYKNRWSHCGMLQHALNSSSHQLSIGRHAPWLVGIKKNSKSTQIHTGVLITSTHVLMDGRMFEGHGDLSELFGDYQSRQTHVMSADIPEFDVPGWESQLKILAKQCDDHLCTSGRELELRPNKILVHDSSNMSLFILEFYHSLPGRSICLDETNDLKKDDEVYIQNYSDPTTLYDRHTVSTAGELRNEVENDALKSTSSRILVRRRGDQFVLVGNVEQVLSDRVSSFTSVFPLRHKICDVAGVCLPMLVPTELKRLTGDENQDRFYTCGILDRPIESPSDYPKEPSIARDAPWLVGVYAPESWNYTGVVISRRHVLADWRLFVRDLKGSEVFGTVATPDAMNTFNTLLPLPRADFQVFVTLSICKDSMCSESVEEEWRPRKLMLKSSALLILEFDKDLPVPPICVHEVSNVSVEESVFIQEYTRPGSMFENGHTTLRLDGNGSAAEGYSQVLVKNENGLFTIVGIYVESRYYFYAPIFPVYQEICAWSGVCASASVPDRDVLPARMRVGSLGDEFPDEPEFEDPPEGEDVHEELEKRECSVFGTWLIFLVVILFSIH